MMGAVLGGGDAAHAARRRWVARAADVGEAYGILFVVAFLSALCGFNTGATMGLHSQLNTPDADALGLHRSGPSISQARADAEIAAAALAAARAALPPGAVDACHTEEHAEYGGEFVVKWGETHLQHSAAACCAACQNYEKCNVWVWCAHPDGCGDGRKHKECWLKQQRGMTPLHISGFRGPDVRWTSGARYSEDEQLRLMAADYERRLRLRANTSLPLVYLDVGIKGKYVGRIEMVLFTHTSPRAAENFRQLCTGEHGIAQPGHEGAGRPYHFKGRPFYRIIDGFIDQAGIDVDSVFGGQFKDDAGGIALEHDRIGLLSMANAGPDTNTAHFSIMLGPAHHLDGFYTIFGEVVTGLEVVKAINALAKGKPDHTATAAAGAFIIDSGQIRRGAPVTPAMLRSGVPRRASSPAPTA